LDEQILADWLAVPFGSLQVEFRWTQNQKNSRLFSNQRFIEDHHSGYCEAEETRAKTMLIFCDKQAEINGAMDKLRCYCRNSAQNYQNQSILH
jgi:hypothetical protein